MTATEEKLLELGNALARSVGHVAGSGCPKMSPVIPCTCGSGAEQAQALHDWWHLSREMQAKKIS